MLNYKDVKNNVLGLVRRGKRQIIWPSDDVRIGNILYYWLQAARQIERGVDSRVLCTAHAREWIDEFCHVKDLVVDRPSVRFTHARRVDIPVQNYGSDFAKRDLNNFIAKYIMCGDGRFANRVAGVADTHDLTINVRRGDYYSVPRWRGDYSFDVVEYVREALVRVQRQAPVRRIIVVSDDLAWCRLKLAWLSEVAQVDFPDENAGPAIHLALLASARRLVLANSTFSYWGGYIASWISATSAVDRPTGVWAPWFHSRRFLGGAAYQLDPDWHIIDDIPGGWDG